MSKRPNFNNRPTDNVVIVVDGRKVIIFVVFYVSSLDLKKSNLNKTTLVTIQSSNYSFLAG